MSTIVEDPAARYLASEKPIPPAGSSTDARLMLYGVSWETYARLVEEAGKSRRVRFAFNQGDLEIMSPGPRHEGDGHWFDHILKIVCAEFEIPYKSYGSTTWKRADVHRGIEADECYYFAAEKLAAAGAAARRKSNDSEDYPIPDLAIEIDLRRSALDRSDIYSALGVPELWSFEDERLLIFELGPDGIYHEMATSRFVPIVPADLVRWAREFEVNDNQVDAERACRAWVREEMRRQRPVP